MTTNVFTAALVAFMDGSLNWESSDIRAILLLSNSTAGDDIDVDTVSAIATLDECDGAGYSRQSVNNRAVTVNDTDDGAYATGDSIVFVMSGNASHAIRGVLVYKHGTNDADSMPLCVIKFSGDVSAATNEITVTPRYSGVSGRYLTWVNR